MGSADPEGQVVTPNVVAVTPIRNRDWMVLSHIDSLCDQHARLAAAFYLTGDNEDATLSALRREARAPSGFVHVEEFNTNSPHWSRDRPGEKYTGDDHASLSRVYNRMVDRALERFPDATHLWLVDSDVLPEPGCLERLLEADKDVIAAVVRHSKTAFNFMTGEQDGEPRRGSEAAWLDSSREMMRHPQIRRVLIPATFLSCCVLYRRAVLENPAHRFAPHPRSHDFPMQAALRASGLDLWVHPLARAEHVMEEPVSPRMTPASSGTS